MRCRAGPDLAGAPRRGPRAARRRSPLADARHALMGQFTAADSWLIMADSLARARQDRGRRRPASVRGPRSIPAIMQLWVGLGNALADHAAA